MNEKQLKIRRKMLEHINVNKPEKDLTRDDFKRISVHRYLTEKFIYEFQDNLNWKLVSEYQKLSEKMIRELQHKVNWIEITSYQKLSTDFIREFQHKIHWGFLSYRQFPDEFLIEFKDNFMWSVYFCSNEASFSILKKFLAKTSIDDLISVKTDHLNSAEIEELEKILLLKKMFTNTKTTSIS